MPFTLLERRLDGQVIEHAVQSPLLLQAQLNSTYILIDSNSNKVPDDMVLKRNGDRLEILIEEQLIATIDGFYVGDLKAMFISEGEFGNSTSMLASDDNENVKDGVVWSASKAQMSSIEEGSDIGGWSLLGAAGVIGAGYSINNNDSDNKVNDADYTITVNAAAGPVTSVLTVELYDKGGNLIASESHDFSTGPFVYSVTDGYSGPLFVKLIDSNTVSDYLDEASNTATNLGEPLRAMVMADGSNNVLLTITPLTELAVRQAGVDEANLAVSEADVAMNDKVGALFNVKDITSDVITILDANFDDSNGLSDAEFYGQVLAVLSGVDNTTGSIDATLVQLEMNLSTNDDDDLVIKPEGAALLSEGATVIKSSTDLDLVDTKIDDDKVIPTAPIFNVIAGDNIINGAEQESDITGTAEAGTEITLNLNSVVRTITTDSDGHWSYRLSVEDVTAIGEGEIALKATAKDAAGNVSATAAQTIYIDTVAPTITSDAIASALDENSGAGQVVYTATSTNSNDITSGATVYSLKAGDDAALLSINSTTGVVVLTANPDDETKADYSFTVVASDSAGNSSEQAITLDINDLDEVAPTITSAAIASSLNENSGAGQVVYTATSTDSGDIAIGATVYSLKVGADAALFTINSSTGAVTLTANPDDETKADYNFTVLATDAAGNSSEQKVTLDITDLDDAAPTITSGASASTINENSGAGQAVYTVTSTDTGDITTGVTTYSLKAGNDASFFTINSSTGVVNLKANPNAGTKADYSFTVVATDGAGNSSEQAIRLDINAIDTTPTDTTPPTITLVSIPDAAMNVDDVVTVTLTVNDDGGEIYTNISGTVGDFALSNLTRTNSTTYTAQFTVANGGTDVAAGSDIPVSLTIDDSSSNTSATYNTAISQAGDAIDANVPVVTAVSIPDSVMNVNDVVTVTLTVDNDGGENYTNIVGTVGGFALSNLTRTNSTTYTAQFTVANGGTDVAAGSDIPVSLTIDDSSSNTSATYNTAISQASDAIDANVPVVTAASIPDSVMNVNDVVTVTLTVDNDGGDTYTNISGTVGGFALSNLTRINSTTYTAQFTVANGGTDVAAGSDIPVSLTIDDSSSNTSASYNTAISQASDVIDANVPVVTAASIPDSVMNVNDVVTVTLTVDNDGGDTYTNISGTVGGFALSNLTRINSTTYTAQFTVANGGTDVAAGSDIPVSLTIDDSSSNTSATYNTAISQASDAIDANVPVVTAALIPDSAMNVNDVVTVTLTVNDDGGDTYTNISGTVGGFALSNLTRTNSTTYTAQFTVANGGTDVAAGSDIPVSLTLDDSSSNTSATYNTAISQAGDAIDANVPVVTAASIPDSVMNVNDVVTVTLTVDNDGGDTYTNISGTVGGFALSNLTRINSTTYTAQFTVANGGTDVAAGSDIPVSLTLDDSSSNTSATYNTAISQASDAIDANVPVVTAASIPDSVMNVNDVVTVTLTVNDDGGDTYTNISGTVGGFALSNLTRTNSTTYTAQFTVANGGTDVAAGSDIPVSLTLDDSSSNTSATYNTAISQASDAIDANVPVVTAALIPDSAMNVNDVVTVTLTVNDDGGDTYTNISGTVGGFALSNLTRTNSTTYTAQFTVANGGTDVAAGSDIPVSLTLDDSSSNTSATYNTAISQASDAIDANVVDTSIVVFDLTSGASSSHNGGSGAARSFDTGVAYTIYIKVSTDSVGISVTNQWSGGSNLGSDDTIILVGSGSAPLGVNGNPAANTDVSQSAIVWSNPTLALLSKDGFIGTFRLGGTSSRGADLWTGTWLATHGSLLQVAGSIPTALPVGVATSQGV